MKYILPFLLCALVLGACKKSSDDDKSNKLQGKWLTFEELLSPGPMGVWEEVKYEDGYIDFRENGEVYSNKVMFANTYKKYKILNDKEIELSESTTSTTNLKVRYEFEGTKLILWFPCIEPCGLKFKSKSLIEY